MRKTIVGCLAILAMKSLFPINNLKQSFLLQQNTGKFKRCIFIVFDGLRPDGFFPSHKKNVYTNNFNHNYNCYNYFSKVDDPTLTASRLEALFTGKRSNFTDTVFAFNHSKSDSSFFKQFNYFYCGDETLENIFGLKGFVYNAYGNITKFKKEYISIYKLIKRSIKPTKSNELLIAHLSSIDSVGHRGGIYKLKIKEIMKLYSDLVNFLAKTLDKDSFIVITSDHGVRENGDHGGTSTEENTSFCSFIFHNSISFNRPTSFSNEDISLSNFYKLKNTTSIISQNDIINTISSLLGKYYPKETTGGLINEFINSGHKLNLLIQKIGLLKNKKYFLKKIFRTLIAQKNDSKYFKSLKNKQYLNKNTSETGDSSMMHFNIASCEELLNTESEILKNSSDQLTNENVINLKEKPQENIFSFENLMLKLNEIEKEIDVSLKIIPNLFLTALLSLIIFLFAKISIFNTFLFFMIIHSVHSFLHEDLILAFFCTKNPLINLILALISNTPQQPEDRFILFKMKDPIIWCLIILLINFSRKIKHCKYNLINQILNYFNEVIELFKVKKLCTTLFLIFLRIILSIFKLDLDRNTCINYLITTLDPLGILYTTNNPICCYFIYFLYSYKNTVLYYYMIIFLIDFNWQMNLNLKFCYFFSDVFELKTTLATLFFRLIYPRIILEIPFEQEIINFSIGLIVCVFTYNQMIFAWFFAGRLILQFIWLIFAILKLLLYKKRFVQKQKL